MLIPENKPFKSSILRFARRTLAKPDGMWTVHVKMCLAQSSLGKKKLVIKIQGKQVLHWIGVVSHPLFP